MNEGHNNKSKSKKEIIVPVKVYIDKDETLFNNEGLDYEEESTNALTDAMFDPSRDIPQYNNQIEDENMHKTPQEQRQEEKKVFLMWSGVIFIAFFILIGWIATLKYSEFFTVQGSSDKTFSEISEEIQGSYRDFSATMNELQSEALKIAEENGEFEDEEQVKDEDVQADLENVGNAEDKNNNNLTEEEINQAFEIQGE